METFGKGGKGGSTHKKQSLAPMFNVNPKAGNATVTGGNFTSDRNKAIARSISTHAKEEKAREIKLQEEIDEAKMISLGVSGGKPSNPGQVIDEEDKKPSAVEESNKPNDKKKSPVVVTDSFSSRRGKKKRVSEMGESVMSPPSNNRRVSNKRARNGNGKSSYASTPTDELVGTSLVGKGEAGEGTKKQEGLTEIITIPSGVPLGVGYYQAGGHIRVKSLQDNTAGLEVGDEIIKVNGIDLSDVDGGVEGLFGLLISQERILLVRRYREAVSDLASEIKKANDIQVGKGRGSNAGGYTAGTYCDRFVY